MYGWEEHGDSFALVMELVEGHPLDELIPRNGMPVAKVLDYAIPGRAGTRGGPAIVMARVRNDGSLAPQPEWVRVSPPEIQSASRPRFTYDGKLIFYIRNEGSVQHLVRQPVDLASGRRLAPPVDVAPVQIHAGWYNVWSVPLH